MSPERPALDTPPEPPPAPPTRKGTPRWVTTYGAPAAVAAAVALGVTGLVNATRDDRTVTVTEQAQQAPPAAGTTGAATVPASDGEATGPLAPGPAPAGPALDAGAIYRKYQLSIVRVESGSRSTNGRLGTGFVIDREGHVLTNAHVIIAGSKTATIRLSDGSDHKATVLGRDEDIDLAVLRAADLPATSVPVPLGSVRTLKVGDPLVAIGNPLGFDLTVTSGIVSALKRPIESPNQCPVQNVVQTDAAINQGNSGGPLFDAHGRVIGINSQIATENGGNVGIGLAVPIDIVKPVAESIIRTGTAQHARLGILGRGITPQIAAANGLKDTKGVMIVQSQPGGAAAKAGLKGATSGTGNNDTPKGGDVITAIDGRPTEDMPDVSLAVNSNPPGAVLRVTVLRAGKTSTVPVTLQNRQGPCNP